MLARYAGVYQFAVGQTMTLRVEGGQLAAQPAGGTALPLLAESETRFFNRDINVASSSSVTARATSQSS